MKNQTSQPGTGFALRQRHFQAGPHRLFGQTVGEPAGDERALVFLHGGVGCVGMWRDFPEILCRRAGLPGLAYDRLGFGRSDPLANPQAETEGPGFRNREGRDSLPQVLDAMGIRSAVLIGHSEGGANALLAAAAHPARIRGVIGLAPQVVVHARAVEGTHEIVEAYRSGGLRERLIKYHGEKFDRTFARWADGWTGPAAAAWSIESELKEIACPVANITGADDEHGYAHNMEALKRCIGAPLTTHLVPGAGHHPQDEARDEVIELIADFLKDL